MIASHALRSAGGSGRNITPVRKVAFPDAAIFCSVRISRASVAPSTALVIPKLFSTPSAIVSCRISSSSVHGGTAFSTRSIAVSTRTPVNSRQRRARRPAARIRSGLVDPYLLQSHGVRHREVPDGAQVDRIVWSDAIDLLPGEIAFLGELRRRM